MQPNSSSLEVRTTLPSAPIRPNGWSDAALLSKAARLPLNPKYVGTALRSVRSRSLRPVVTLCPYCGSRDQLFGTVSLPGRRTLRNVRLTNDRQNPWMRGKEDTTLCIAACVACGVHFDLRAYHSPRAFLLDVLSPEEGEQLQEYFAAHGV
jgi:hypothetical protein